MLFWLSETGKIWCFPGILVVLCGFSSLWWPFGWNWSYLGFLGIIWRTYGSKCRGEGGGIFPTLCVECCLVEMHFQWRKCVLHMASIMAADIQVMQSQGITVMALSSYIPVWETWGLRWSSSCCCLVIIIFFVWERQSIIICQVKFQPPMRRNDITPTYIKTFFHIQFSMQCIALSHRIRKAYSLNDGSRAVNIITSKQNQWS